ncbi:MAG: hypothetical protein IJM10_05230, partial [Clostridia bacterium]|nr:hypothetical protein [Clostridia bacterium]
TLMNIVSLLDGLVKGILAAEETFFENPRDFHALETNVKASTESFATGFLSVVLEIGSVYFNFDISSVNCDKFDASPDIEPMLNDILNGGVYGPGDPDHLHAGIFTFNGYSEMLGVKKHRLHAILPPKEKIRQKYPFAEKHPVLLPAAYFIRLFSYMFSNHSTADVFDMARQRKELMRQYGINK